MTNRNSTYVPIQMSVKGQKRTVHLEESLKSGSARARLYVRGKTVSGNVKVSKSGARTFTASGVNAGLLN